VLTEMHEPITQSSLASRPATGQIVPRRRRAGAFGAVSLDRKEWV